MKGLRGATDVILRLPRSTIDFLSVFIGFGSLSKVKTVVFDENLTFIQIVIEKVNFFSIFYFDPGVIWGRFRHRKSI